MSGSARPDADPASPPRPAPLAESDLFTLAGPSLLEAASDYVQLQRVQHPRRRGDALAAEVEGTDEVHRVRVRCERAGSLHLRPDCSCPSSRPYCRHVLAVLLLWSRRPEAFAAIDDLEAVAAGLPTAVSAAALAEAAMGGDPLELLERLAEAVDWTADPPGRCLQHWPAVRALAVRQGRWPEAAFSVARRIAGVPGDPPPAEPRRALATRQLAWWLTLTVGDLPSPAVHPWLLHLFTLLEAGLPPWAPETAVWLARLAVALPAPHAAEARWLGRFAAAAPGLAAVFEAEVESARWAAEAAWRLAAGGSAPGAASAGTPPAASPPGLQGPGRPAAAAREVLAAFAEEAGSASSRPTGRLLE